MTLIQEVPGAGERPGGSRIRVECYAEERETILQIPARSTSLVVSTGAIVLAINLLAVLWMGVELFFWHHSVGVMQEIAPHDLPLPLLHWSLPLLLGWIAVEGLGAVALVALVQPAFVYERLTFSPDEVEWQQKGWGRTHIRTIPQANSPHFHLKRDPQGLTTSVLTLRDISGKVEFAEHVTEAEREWLCSVGNALLRDL